MYNKIISAIVFCAFVFPAHAQDAPGYPGAVRKIDLPLVSETRLNQKRERKKTFQAHDVKGWLSEDNNWYIKGLVTHQRLRCASYNLGVQLGKGNPACLNVEWITKVHYGTLKKHCNSASLMHVGGGETPELGNILLDATCVRVVTRCTGVCDGSEK